MATRMNGGDIRLIAFFRQLLDLSHLEPGRDPVPLVERVLALLVEATPVDHVFLELEGSDPVFQRCMARGGPLDPSSFVNPLTRRLLDGVISNQRVVVMTTARTTSLCVPIAAPPELALRAGPPRGIGVIYAQVLGSRSEGVRGCVEALATEICHRARAITAGQQSLENESEQFRQRWIAAAIQQKSGNVAAAARLLQVPRSNLYEWIGDLPARRRPRRKPQRR